MGKDGKFLENLVRQIEAMLLPGAFTVKANSQVYDDAGVQIAEFDIEIRGRLGSTDIAWLIECRDRPSEGSAPGSWIEQLVGRRDRFGFDRVTAVSTTGFSVGATDYARDRNIELRHVRELQLEDVATWLGTQHIVLTQPCTKLEAVMFLVDDNEPKPNKDAMAESISGKNGNALLLRSIETSETISAAQAFAVAVTTTHPELFNDILPNMPGKRIRTRVTYPNDSSHFVVDTIRGPIRVKEILFAGILSTKMSEIPLSSIREYAHDATGEVIAQSAAFSANGHNLSFELHKMGESSETHVVIRRL